MVEYQWELESWATVEHEVSWAEFGVDDIIEGRDCDSFAECLERRHEFDSDVSKTVIVLVRSQWRNGNPMRSWAYLQSDGQLPVDFLDAYDRPETKVPKRFHEEVARGQTATQGIPR